MSGAESPYAVINPATGERVADYPTISDADLRAAIDAAAAAHRSWSATPVAERAAVIGRVADLHEERR
jgi:succinate-semialdehyde dehydrogenase/glutarate-semialdehyde dehydrogenase